MTDSTALFAITAMAAASAAVTPISAQVNSPGPDGYLARAGLMYADRIYQGTADQSREAAAQLSAASPAEQQLYLSSMAAVRLGSPDAQRLLTEFASRFPASPRIGLIHIAMGDCFLNRGDYAGAMAQYTEVDPATLGGTDRDDLIYRKAYCALMSGDFTTAGGQFALLSNSRDYAGAARFYTGYLAYASGDYTQALRLLQRASGDTEPVCAAPYYIAQIRYCQSDWEEAAKIARRLIDSPRVPSMTPEMTRILGESLWNSTNDPAKRREAIDLLWTYVASTPDPEPSALYILGVSEYDAGHTSEAIGLLQRVITGDTPLSQSAYLYLGQAYSAAGNSNAALMAYEHAYRMDFNREVAETAFYNYVATRLDGGSAPFGSTVSLLESFLRQYPDSRYSPEVERYLLTGYLAENDYEAALAGIERIKNPSPAVEGARQRVLFVLGTRDYTAGRYGQALQRFAAARAISPAQGGDASIAEQALIWSGDTHYAMEQYDAAATDYQAFLRAASPKDPNRQTALYDLAYARFAGRHYAEALADFGRYIASHPASADTEADAYSRMGDCRYYANNFSGAAADYRRAFELSPANGDYPLYQLALMKGLVREHRVKIETLDEMITRYPGSPLVASALLEKAQSYAAINDQSSAIATYMTLTERFPSTAQGRKGLLQLAIMRLAAGQRKDATDTYRKVISTYPTSEEAQLALDDLKRIYAEEGTLAELTSFLATVSGAPSVDRSEYDDLSFDAAEKAYIRNDQTERLETYLTEYPRGAHRPQALFYLAEAARSSGNTARALELATEVVTLYPDAEVAEEALLIKADAEAAGGRTRAAFDTYAQLEQRASTPALRHQARIGIIRHGVTSEEWDAVISAVEHLGASSTAGDTDRPEIGWSYGRALAARGRNEEAARSWQAVIDGGNGDLYASRSAVDLARMQLDLGQLNEARATADKFINSNPPHPYWLAQGFIVYSDILRRNGETFEADEYLRSLRNNYPGKEEDIFRMIDQRLNDN